MILSLVILIAAGRWVYNAYQEDTVLWNQNQDLAWEKVCRTEGVVFEKIQALNEAADKLEKRVGNLGKLGAVIEHESLPDVIEHRWRQYGSSSSRESLEEINQAVEAAIKQVLTAQELLKDDEVDIEKKNPIYHSFSSIACSKNNWQIEEARIASRGQFETMMEGFWKREMEIGFLTYDKMSKHEKELRRRNRELLSHR